MEQLEERQLLATGFLQGIAFVDANNNNQLEANDTRLAGALIQLYNQSGSQLLAQTTTNATGYYLFTGLAPGTYRLVETPPNGYTNQGAQVLSQLDPASAVNASTIQVTVVDPSQLTVSFNSTQYFQRQKWEQYSYSFFGQTQQNSIGQLPVTVSGPGGFTTPEFLSLCVDLFHSLTRNGSGNTFSVTASPTLTGQGNPQNWGRIAYLYNQYGTSDLSTVDAAGLQLAIYELEYGSNIGSFVPLSPTTAADLQAAQAQANSYIADSVGQSEAAIFLDATQGGKTVPQDGRQGLIVTGSFNFGNVPLPPPPAITVNTLGLLPLFPMTPQAAPAMGLASKVQFLGSNVLASNGTVSAQAAFVEGLYQNLLDRMASAAEVEYWVMLLQEGVSRQAVVNAIWVSPEHLGLEVAHFYVAFLDRSPSPAEVMSWVNVLLSGWSEQSVIQAILLSPEYQAAHASNLAFVTGLYADVLGRAPDAPGLAGCLQALQNGESRAELVQAFLYSPEAEGDVIEAFYQYFLQRPASPAEEQFWLGLLQSNQLSLTSVAEMILASEAYFAQFANL